MDLPWKPVLTCAITTPNNHTQLSSSGSHQVHDTEPIWIMTPNKSAFQQHFKKMLKFCPLPFPSQIPYTDLKACIIVYTSMHRELKLISSAAKYNHHHHQILEMLSHQKTQLWVVVVVVVLEVAIVTAVAGGWPNLLCVFTRLRGGSGKQFNNDSMIQ